MAAGCDREGPVGAPELTGVLDLKAGVAKPLLRLGVVRRDHGDVSEDGRRVPRGEEPGIKCPHPFRARTPRSDAMRLSPPLGWGPCRSALGLTWPWY
jgi:hypothetical protein